MATLNGIRDALSSYDPDRRSMIQCDVKATIALHVMADPQLNSDVCVSNLRADLPPEVLYAREMLRAPLFYIALSVITSWLRDCHTPRTLPLIVFLTVW